jgi:hypothetical protein
VVFSGRADQQVKIRGFRVELGEIEAALRRHPAVAEAVAVAREDVPGDRRLVAYIVPTADHRPPTTETEDGGWKIEDGRAGAPEMPSSILHPPSSILTELRAYLKQHLPGYMVPAALVPLDALPVTPNGKIDRRALPRPDSLRGGAETAYTAPENDIERTIAALWQEVLHVEMVGLHDNFFDLGGNSMHIVQVQSKIREILNRDLPVVELFKYPTVGLLAKHLNREQEEQPSLDHIRDRAEQQKAALGAIEAMDIQAVLGKLARSRAGQGD